MTPAGVLFVANVRRELLSLPKATNEQASDNAAHQMEIVHPIRQRQEEQTRRRLTENQAR
jgi:hypothetical protein